MRVKSFDGLVDYKRWRVTDTSANVDSDSSSTTQVICAFTTNNGIYQIRAVRFHSGHYEDDGVQLDEISSERSLQLFPKEDQEFIEAMAKAAYHFVYNYGELVDDGL